MNPELEEGWYWVRWLPAGEWKPAEIFREEGEAGLVRYVYETTTELDYLGDDIEVGPRIHPPEGEGEER